MATSASVPAWDTVTLAKQLQTIASQSQTLMQSFLSQQQNWGQIGMGDASAIGGAFADLNGQDGGGSGLGRESASGFDQ